MNALIWPALALLCACVVASVPEHRVDELVKELLTSMTVAEKARQLDIYRTADMLTNGAVDMVKAEKSWGNLSLGVGILHDMYPYPQIANQIMSALLNASRLKVPPAFGAEATHGLQMDDHTIFPSPIGLAATFDVETMRAYGNVVGSEARAAGLHVTWAPVLGLCQEPRWGRCEEMMGEDPHLAAELGRAAISGFTQNRNFTSPRAVAPLMKHYAAYSVPEGGHNCAPAHIGRRELLSTFVPPFAAGMEAGAQAIMVSYNEIDGEPNAGSHFLLTQIPREQVGGNGPQPDPFKGYVSADFGAIHNLNGVHKVAKDAKEAITQYINAGGSVSGFDFDHPTWQDSIVNSVADGSLPEEALDAATGRVLAVKARLGLFDEPLVKDVDQYRQLITSKEHEEVALNAARKSIVLLQNQPDKALNSGSPVLPFDAASVKKIAVLGPNADQPQCGDYAAGGSWGADKCGGGPVNNLRTTSIVGGIKALLPHAEVTYSPGIPVADFDESAPYFTTIQRHSFTTMNGSEGIVGTYFASQDFTGKPAFSRNDYMLSFHFLNYGPDPIQLPRSAFSAQWEGYLTPDLSVDAAVFALTSSGGDANATLWLDGNKVMTWNQSHKGTSSPVTLTRGQKVHLRFAYSQGDMTGSHPAFALQWNLQGSSAVDSALATIADADVVIVAVGGGTSVTSGEGVDRSSLGLPGAQLNFLQAVRKVAIDHKKPMATIVVQGKAFGEQWVKQSLPAVVEAWFAGQGQGRAITEVLFGFYNPAGRAAVSFPVSADVLPVYYNHKPSASRGGYNNPPVIPGGLYPPTSPSSASVLWAFGHGLSYGSKNEYVQFNYSGISVSPASIGLNGSVEVKVHIVNNGTRDAEEVPQLYVRDDIASVTTPVMQLRGFQRLAIRAGQGIDVSFSLSVARDLWIIDKQYQKIVEPGSFTLMVGGASDMIQQSAKLEVLGTNSESILSQGSVRAIV